MLWQNAQCVTLDVPLVPGGFSGDTYWLMVSDGGGYTAADILGRGATCISGGAGWDHVQSVALHVLHMNAPIQKGSDIL